MRKYYFAYHLVNGNPFPFTWVEEGGMPVGGIPEVASEIMEITEEQHKFELHQMELEFPWEKHKRVTPPEEQKPI